MAGDGKVGVAESHFVAEVVLKQPEVHAQLKQKNQLINLAVLNITSDYRISSALKQLSVCQHANYVADDTTVCVPESICVTGVELMQPVVHVK